MKIESVLYNDISIAKGIGILCVVIGHSGCPAVMRDFIYMFHMPLFFIISGYCFKDKYLTDFKLFAKKRIKGLYIPFAKYSILFLLLHNLFYTIGVYNVENGVGYGFYDIRTILNHFAKVFLLINYEPLISPLWFVAALFVGYFVFYVTKRYIQKEIYLGLLLLSLSLISIFIPIAQSSHPIIFRSTYASFFLWVGSVLSTHFRRVNRWEIFSICFIIVCVGSVFFPTEMPKVNINSLFPYSICSIAGTIMVLSFSQLVENKDFCFSKLLGYIGNHTMAILVWHFTCFKLVTAFLLLMSGASMKMLAKFPTISDNAPNNYWLLYTLVGVVIPLLIHETGERISSYLSFVFNRKNTESII